LGGLSLCAAVGGNRILKADFTPAFSHGLGRKLPFKIVALYAVIGGLADSDCVSCKTRHELMQPGFGICVSFRIEPIAAFASQHGAPGAQ
jgi:hypothetical protein